MKPISSNKILDTLRFLFNGCQQRSGCRFPNALIPVYSGSPVQIYQYSVNEVYDYTLALRGLVEQIDKGKLFYETDAEMSVRLSVHAYCHIMEADLLYLILLNLCRVAEGLKCDWLFMAREKDDSFREKDGDVYRLNKISDKIEHLKKYDLAKESQLSTMLEGLWDGELRNAFSHSQYFIDSEGKLGCIKWAHKTSSESFAKNGQFTGEPLYLEKKDIKSLSESAFGYIRIFGDLYHEFVTPYKSTSSVSLDDFDVFYDTNKRVWRREG